jgi:N12 class adenine-specific DNA methylase
MMTVPGHCLAQAAREFLQLYPTARIPHDSPHFCATRKSLNFRYPSGRMANHLPGGTYARAERAI